MSNEKNKDFSIEPVIKLFHIFWHRKWVIMTVVLLGFGLSLYRAVKMQDYYTTTTQILVQKVERQNNQKRSFQAESQDISYYKTQVRLIESPSVARETARLLDLKNHYNVETVRQAAGILSNNVNATLLRDTRIIALSVTDRDPEMAANIANSLSQVYIKKSLQDQFFVSDQILKLFPGDAGVTKSSTAQDVMSVLDNEALMMSLPSVMDDPLIVNLDRKRINLESDYRQLISNYTEEHPSVKEIKSQLSYLDSEKVIHARKITASLKSSIASELNISNIKVMDEAEVPNNPSGPNRSSIITKGTLFSFFLICGLIYLIDAVNATVRVDDDLIQLTDVPMLGQIAKVNIQADIKAKKAIDALMDNHVISDCVTTLRTSLIFSMPQGKNKRILFTSSLPSEGKTSVSYLLAASMAKLGEKVLFVEMDLRKPSLGTVSNIAHPEGIGMTDVLSGQKTVDDVLFKSSISDNLDVISAGAPSPNPTTLITSGILDEFFEEMDKKYDRIIIDTPPSYVMPDAIMLTSKAHGVVFVVGSNKSHQKIVKKTIDKIKFVNATIFGTVLNQVQSVHVLYGTKYGYGHYGAKK